MAQKATLDSLSKDVGRLTGEVQGLFKRFGQLLTALTGTPDGTVEGLVHRVKDLKEKFEAHEDEHNENDGKVSENLAGYNAGIEKKFKVVWIGLGCVAVVAIVGFLLAVGLPAEALKSAFLLIFETFGG